MICINYIDKQDKPTPSVYVKLNDNTFTFSMPEEGIFSKTLSSYETYYVLARLTKKEDFKNDGSFENIFFKDKKIRIISKSELLSLYGLRNFDDILNKVNSTVAIKRMMLICTGFINCAYNIFNAQICVYGNLDNFNIKSPFDITYKGFDDRTTFVADNYESDLWNSYSLTINGVEYKSNYDGIPVEELDNRVSLKEGEDFLEFHIQKYNTNKFTTIANAESDTDIVSIRTNEEFEYQDNDIILSNGAGSFKIYPKDYKGEFFIKIRPQTRRRKINEYKFVLV